LNEVVHLPLQIIRDEKRIPIQSLYTNSRNGLGPGGLAEEKTPHEIENPGAISHHSPLSQDVTGNCAESSSLERWILPANDV
jgi:hypothetical protein